MLQYSTYTNILVNPRKVRIIVMIIQTIWQGRYNHITFIQYTVFVGWNKSRALFKSRLNCLTSFFFKCSIVVLKCAWTLTDRERCFTFLALSLWRPIAVGLFWCFIKWSPVVVHVVNLKNDMKSYLYFRFRVFLTARISSIQLSCPGLRPIFGTPIISFKSTLTGANAESALEMPI